MASLEQPVNVKMRKLNHSVTMNVHVIVTREYKIRRWIALNLIAAACLILGCGIKIEDQNG